MKKKTDKTKMDKPMDEHRVMFIDIPVPKSRSVSPLSPSPCRDRNNGFFDMISRRFGRRSHDELCFHNHTEEDSRSSSTDSCSSTSGRITVNAKNVHKHNSNIELNCLSSDSSSSDSSDNQNQALGSRQQIHRRSSSSIRRALQNLSLSSRSLSCSSTPSQKTKKAKKTPPPKRILRQPVSYTYLKGMSGLPTQRVPRSSVCCHYAHR